MAVLAGAGLRAGKLAAALAASLFCLLALAASGLAAASPRVAAPSSTPAVLQLPFGARTQAQLIHQLAAPGDVGKILSMTDGQIRTLLHGTPWAAADPGQVRSLVRSTLTPDASLTALDSGYWAGFLIGCAVGGGIGLAAGGPVGAGVGCVLGGAVIDLIIYFGTQSAGDAAAAAELQYQESQANLIANEIIYTEGFIHVSQSVGNSTFNAFASMADAAALQQLPNAQFDPLADLNASGVAFQQATLMQDYANSVQGAFSSLNFGELNAYAPGGTYSSTCQYELVISTPQLAPATGCTAGSTSYIQAMGGEIETSGQNGTGLFIASNGTAWISCNGASAASMTSVTNGTLPGTVVQLSKTTTYTLVQPRVSAVWRFALTGGTGCDVLGSGVMGVPANANNPSTGIVFTECGAQAGPSNSLCNPNNPNQASFGKGSFSPSGSFISEVQQTRMGSGIVFGPLTWPTAAFKYLQTQENALMVAAATNAQAYWLFLRALGYTNANQIPSNCIIPMPSQIAPPQYSSSLGTLTLNQTLSLYQAWMNGLAVFFNTAQNATTFCKGHAPFSVGFTAWNLNVMVTGFAFTLPVAHQVFGTMSTWTVTNNSSSLNQVGTGWHGKRSDPTPMVLWPTVKTLYVPVGRVQEVPINDPLFDFVPANGTLYQLFGNGTAAGQTGFSNGTANSQTGAAIYVSTCSVLQPNGQYAPVLTYCPLVLSSIVNVTFPTGSTPVVNPFTGGGNACGQTLPVWTQFVQFYSGFFAWTGGLQCGLAEAFAFVTLVVIVVAAAAVIGAVVRAGRGR